MKVSGALQRFKRSAPLTIAIGAGLMLVQNVLLLSGVGLLLSGSASTGSALVPVSLLIDLAGIFLIALGIIFLTLPDCLGRTKGAKPFWTPTRLGLVSGLLCLMWFFLTVGWRIVGLGAISDTLDIVATLPSESSEFTAAMTSLFLQIRVVMAVWIFASLSLVFASILFALHMKRRDGWRTGVVAWPFFCILNACGTVFLAGVVIALTTGAVDFPLIVTAAALKLITIPLFGILAYFSLTMKFIGFMRAEKGGAKVEKEPSTDVIASEESESEEAK